MSEYRFKLDVDQDGVFFGSELAKKPEQNKRERKCKICEKKLSTYNTTRYCYVHQAQGQAAEDKKNDEEKSRKYKAGLQKRRKRNGNQSSDKRRSTKNKRPAPSSTAEPKSQSLADQGGN